MNLVTKIQLMEDLLLTIVPINGKFRLKSKLFIIVLNKIKNALAKFLTVSP